jgi:uncharacterized protein (DUF736 family)
MPSERAIRCCSGDKQQKENTMSIIANMKKQENGSFEGKLKTATLNLHLKLQPIGDAEANDNKPDFRAKIGSFEAGAGWNKISDNQNPYISVQIDAPEFPNPIYANLVQKDDQYILIWSRQN